MPRPVTLFTGQWADLPFEEVCRLASGWGYDGLELACWGDHFDPWAAVEDDSYVPAKLEMLEKHDLQVFAISNHLKGQAVCDDPIDERHQGILPSRIWGDGDAEGVRQRAAEEMKMTARAAQRLGVDTVVGFTGSSIWKYVAMFPRATATSPTAGTRSSTSSTSAACGSPTRCTPPRSPTTTGRPRRPWRRSGTARRSASTGTRATSCGRTSTRSGSCGTSRTGSTTSTARTRSARSATAATVGSFCFNDTATT